MHENEKINYRTYKLYVTEPRGGDPGDGGEAGEEGDGREGNDPTIDVGKDSAQPLSSHEKKQLKVLTPP